MNTISRRALPIFLLMLLPSMVFAAETPLPGTPALVHRDFNKVARSLGDPQRLKLKGCSQNVSRVCAYTLDGHQILSAQSKGGKLETLNALIVLLSAVPRPNDIAATMRILLLAYVADTTPAARDEAMVVFAQAVQQRKSEARVTLGRTQFTFSGDPDSAMFMIIEAKRD